MSSNDIDVRTLFDTEAQLEWLVVARFQIGQMLGVAAGASLGGALGETFGWRS